MPARVPEDGPGMLRQSPRSTILQPNRSSEDGGPERKKRFPPKPQLREVDGASERAAR